MSPAIRLGMMVLMAVTAGSDCWAQTDAQLPQRSSGAWRVERMADQQGSFLAIASAVDNSGASFSLACHKDPDHYYFAIRDSRLAELRSADEASLATKTGDREPVRVLATSLGDGRLVIRERVHQTAFSLLLASLAQSDAATLEVSLNDRRWAFPLAGFAAALQSLAERCGFAPDPERATRRSPEAGSDRVPGRQHPGSRAK